MIATDALAAFAEEIGPHDPVVPAGAKTQWAVGGLPAESAREVTPPSGIVSYEPAEMVVRCRAGTPVRELDGALAAHGQMVPLDPVDTAATVGGVLAVGHSGLRRLRYGPVRDTVLQTRFVSAAGRIVTAGGAVVKNVSGFDLCRVLVGSLGTIGVLAEVVLRVQPRPPGAVWLCGDDDPIAVRRRLFRPSAILWDGTRTWVLLEGRAADITAERAALGRRFAEVDGPPVAPRGGRMSVRPREVIDRARQARGAFLAEVGVGTVHLEDAVAPAPVPVAAARLHRAIKVTFDPEGRLNPGRVVG